MVKIYAIGGYSEVGKNMTAIEVDEDVFIFDEGFFLPAIVKMQEQERDEYSYSEARLRDVEAIPDDRIINDIRYKVCAQFIGHAHLDHVGAVPFISDRYNAPIYCTPFTAAVLESLLVDNDVHLRNKIRAVHPNTSFYVQGKKNKYLVEFVNMTHSVPQTSFIVLHTNKGAIVYANDFKLDDNPIVGVRPNYERLKQIAKQGVLALIIDSLYAGSDRKTPSEKIARSLLEEVMFTIDNRKSGMIVTTFSSHIARLKSIVEFGRRLNREVLFLGRSLNKYSFAAQRTGLAPFIKDVHLAKYRRQVEKALSHVEKRRQNYLVACTGHQGEPGSILERISRNQFPFKVNEDDNVIFSSSVIPTEINVKNFGEMETKLRKRKARIFRDVHVSVLPDTEVVLNDSNGMKIKEIGEINDEEQKELRVPAFDSELKIKWLSAKLVKHNYIGKIFKIFTKSGRNVAVTSGHSLFKLEGGKIKSEIGDNIKEGDYLAIPKRFSWDREIKEVSINQDNLEEKNGILHYNNKPVIHKKIVLNKDFARFLGYYLAEGSSPKHISLVINKQEKEIEKEIVDSINSVFLSKPHNYRRGNALEICFGARIIGKILKKWFGDNAKTKKIPSFVFSASDEFKLNFLGAYINGDGCIDKGKRHFRIRIKTASKKLASDLIYLCSQVGICAKFDHIQKNYPRCIAGNKMSPETFAYVIRIQGINDLIKLKDFLAEKFRIGIKNNENRQTLTFPPESLPIEKLDLSNVKAKKETFLSDIIKYSSSSKKKKQHISPAILRQQAEEIDENTERILEGELLFDPVTKIEISEYSGKVYDFSVPGAENFIGGFGGIMLHNSGHGGREDLREVLKLLNPQHVIPSHGGFDKTKPMQELAIEMGYKEGKSCHLVKDGDILEI